MLSSLGHDGVSGVLRHFTTAANENDRQDAIDVLRRAASVWTSLEHRLLFAIASGETYGALAAKDCVPVSTVKTRVRRARLKIDH